MDHILYWSGSIGLGHVTRDIVIANQLRKMDPRIKIDWLAGDPARTVLKKAGENVLPEADRIENGNDLAATIAKGSRFDLYKWSMGVRKSWDANIKAYKDVINRNDYDVIVGDESFEVPMAAEKDPKLNDYKFILIFDYLGVHALTWNPIERLFVRIYNQVWSKSMARSRVNIKAVFVGEKADVADQTMGWFLPNKLELAEKGCEFVGYVTDFDPAKVARGDEMKERLGYGSGPLIVCSIGGTAVGKGLLVLCNSAFPLVRKELKDATMVLVGGPALPDAGMRMAEGVEFKGYVPRLWEHFAASDLSIVIGGGTSTIELTALQKSFIYFPLEGHHEQQGTVADRCARYGAGIKMSISTTSPEDLARAILDNVGKKVEYPPIPVDGAIKAAKYIMQVGAAK